MSSPLSTLLLQQGLPDGILRPAAKGLSEHFISEPMRFHRLWEHQGVRVRSTRPPSDCPHPLWPLASLRIHLQPPFQSTLPQPELSTLYSNREIQTWAPGLAMLLIKGRNSDSLGQKHPASRQKAWRRFHLPRLQVNKAMPTHVRGRDTSLPGDLAPSFSLVSINSPWLTGPLPQWVPSCRHSAPFLEFVYRHTIMCMLVFSGFWGSPP